MIVTIEELEQGKWCPDARVRAQGGPKDVAANRIVEGRSMKAAAAKAFCCVGPECMAWRWYEHGVSGYCGRAGSTYPTDKTGADVEGYGGDLTIADTEEAEKKTGSTKKK